MKGKGSELHALLGQFDAYAGANEPCSRGEMRAAERRLGFRMTRDFLAAYRLMDGTSSSTPPERGWVRLWPVEKWYTVRDYYYGETGPGELGRLTRAVVFSDYCDESWHYAAWFPRFWRRGSASIYLLHERPHLTFPSLPAFLQAVLKDAPEIHPPG